MNTSVLVVIPTLGQRPQWLEWAISSVTEQIVDATVVVRIVTPPGTDLGGITEGRSLEILESSRPGLSAAINDGWTGSEQYTYLAWLGDDDLLAPSALQRCVEALEANVRATAAFGSIRYIDEDGHTRWLPRPRPMAIPYFYIGKNLIPQQGSLFRASTVRSIGGVDERYRSAMDQDFFARLREQGPLVRVRNEVGAFRLHDSNITVTKGAAGVDEGDQIRSRYVGRAYPIIRLVTRLTDRFVYWVIRRLPAGQAPEVSGAPYVNPARRSR